MKKGNDSKEMEDDNLETYQEVSEAIQAEEDRQDMDEMDENLVSTGVADQESRLENDSVQFEEYQQAVPEDMNETQEPERSENETDETGNISAEMNLEFEGCLTDKVPDEINDTKESKSFESDTNDEQYSFESNEPGFNEMNVNSEEMTSGIDLESVVETSFGSVKNTEDTVKSEEHSVSAEDRLGESVEQSKEETENTQSNVGDNSRSSTFVVKTDVLSPTLSVSSVIPETSTGEQNEMIQSDIKTEVEQVTSDISAMNVTDDKEKDSTITDGNNECVVEKQSKETDEGGESFKDAVEDVK